MDRDPFSRCHPAVQFLFFLGAIGFGVVIQHPAYLLAGWVAAAGYYLRSTALGDGDRLSCGCLYLLL